MKGVLFMGLRFHKKINILPGVDVNVSKSGLGLSVGPKGIGNAKTVKIVNVVMRTLCVVTFVACVIGFYLCLFLGVKR